LQRLASISLRTLYRAALATYQRAMPNAAWLVGRTVLRGIPHYRHLPLFYGTAAIPVPFVVIATTGCDRATGLPAVNDTATSACRYHRHH